VDKDESDFQLEQLSKAAAAARAHTAVVEDVEDSEQEDELEEWGTTKRDFYGADELETEQAALDEEAEAKRIQSKHLQAMTDADYGFDDADWAIGDSIDHESKDQVNGERFTETLPEIVIPEDASAEELSKVLKERYPEFQALSKEFNSLQPEHLRLRSVVTRGDGLDKNTLSKYLALATYLSSLAMYFAILTETADESGKAFAKAPVELRDHDVMNALVSCRGNWIKVKDLPENADENKTFTDIEKGTKSLLQPFIVVENQIDGILPTSKSKQLKTKKSKKSKAEKDLKKSKTDSSEARRAARQAAVEEDLAQLTTYTRKPSNYHAEEPSKVTFRQNGNGGSDSGDDQELTVHEAAEKERRRKSLGFYTSKIVQKEMRRGAASRDAGGDMDIPRRDRWKDRQERFQAEAERRREQKGAAEKDVKGSKDHANSSDEYEDLVARSKEAKAAKKAAKKDVYEARVAAQNEIYDDDQFGGDGKRKISYQIEKNKGLAPFRKKDSRNPRVKKRKQFELKKKKLSSIRAVYKGGPGSGGYNGELTGIKTGLVKSIKLSG
jgi:U3 small nucleolar RNA-associated protein 3